jgi:Glycosyl hydrolase family 66
MLKIWTAVRETPAGDVVHFVNLIGVDNALWRDAASTPQPRLRATTTLTARVRS